jgi:hypothetical protein
LHAELRAGCLARPTHPTITNRSSPHYAEALVAAGWPVGEWEKLAGGEVEASAGGLGRVGAGDVGGGQDLRPAVEVKIATVRSGPHQGGFAVGEVFTGNGQPGQIVRISPDGATVQNPWVTLEDAPGVVHPGLLRGSLFQDRYGVFGGDLIVVTTAGGVFRVTSAGATTRLANLDTHLEGVTTVPDLPRYGPWAGKIVVGAEQLVPPEIIAIDASGSPPDRHRLGISPEDIEIIPTGENFVGVDFGGRQLLGAPASEFAGMVGDFLIAQEQGGGVLWHVRWDPASGNFQTEQVARVEHWEHVTFAPVGFPLFEYAVKFICGTSQGDVVAPGVYYTAINVHNPTNTVVGFRKKFAVAPALRAVGQTDEFL